MLGYTLQTIARTSFFKTYLILSVLNVSHTYGVRSFEVDMYRPAGSVYTAIHKSLSVFAFVIRVFLDCRRELERSTELSKRREQTPDINRIEKLIVFGILNLFSAIGLTETRCTLRDNKIARIEIHTILSTSKNNIFAKI